MKMVRTCFACPTQYDLFLDDGRYAYFRYRHGYWSLELYATKDDFDALDWEAKLLAEVGQAHVNADGSDGFMSDSQVMGLLEIALPTLLQKAEL